jgi:hypothetical protein
VANTLGSYRNWAVGFIDWLDAARENHSRCELLFLVIGSTKSRGCDNGGRSKKANSDKVTDFWREPGAFVVEQCVSDVCVPRQRRLNQSDHRKARC